VRLRIEIDLAKLGRNRKKIGDRAAMALLQAQGVLAAKSLDWMIVQLDPPQRIINMKGEQIGTVELIRHK
jgi:hypothetical protein